MVEVNVESYRILKSVDFCFSKTPKFGTQNQCLAFWLRQTAGV